MSDIDIKKLGPSSEWQLGQVKWFGGYNRQKERDNNFGFISSLIGDDIYVHRDALFNTPSLNNEDIVLYRQIKGNNGKPCANDVFLFKVEDIHIPIIAFKYLKESKQSSLLRQEAFKKYLLKIYNGCYGKNVATNFKSHIDNLALSLGFKEFVSQHYLLDWVTSQTIDKYVEDYSLADALNSGIPLELISRSVIEKIVQTEGFSKILAYISPCFFSANFIEKNIVEFKAWLNALTGTSIDAEPSILVKITGNLIDHLSFNSILYLSLYRVLDIPQVIAKYHDNLAIMVKELYKGIESTHVAPLVWEAYHSLYPTMADFSHHPLVRDLFLKAQIKHKFYKKEFRPIIEGFYKTSVANDPEVFILTKALPLLHARKPLEQVANTIFNEVWIALQNKRFDINNPAILSLFPSCSRMSKLMAGNDSGIRLSCEAFYWRTETESETEANYNKYNVAYNRKGKKINTELMTYKQIINTGNYDPNIFLCRSKRCGDPQFTPYLERHFLDYSFYDWLAHYGYSYSSENKPLKIDFAVKLAGYLNRVREIYTRLHCRQCGVLMTANKKYAKTETLIYDEYKNDFVMKPTHAAYRATVFHCNNPDCIQCGNNYYINHCLNYKCYNIIDSRDLTAQCDEGLYICKCGSCCKQHAEKYGNVNNGESEQQKYQRIYSK
ncbi:hypothetical protein [Aeromonas sobria]|nr:hypothetical protein [Aeromonas sobria]